MSNGMMIDYTDAKAEHATLEKIAEVLTQAGLSDGGEEIWNAITQSQYTPNGDLGAQVALWAPVPALPLVRAQSSIAAGFALACMGEQVVERVAQHKALPNDPQSAMEVARAGWTKFEDRRVLAETMKGGLGCSIDASWEHARAVQNVSNPKQLDNVKKIADLAGKMYTVLAEMGPKMEIDGPGEIRNVRAGGDVERVVGEDLAKLADADLGESAMIDLLEDKTREYETKQMVPGARGPLVILRDESGSMDNQVTGDSRNSWASAACVALARTAHDGGRVASVVHYATACAVTDLMPGDSKALLDMATHFLNGGTAIGLALEVGIKRVKALADRGQRGADIVLVTDGEDYDVHRINKAIDEMDRLGIDLYTVLVECDLDQSNPLVARAKKVVEIGDITNVQVIAQLRDSTQQNAPAEPDENGPTASTGGKGPAGGLWN